MSYDVFKFVALRPPEPVKVEKKQSTIRLTSVSATEALDIHEQLTMAKDDKALKKAITSIGADKSLSALMLSGADSAILNKVITTAELSDDDEYVVVESDDTPAAVSLNTGVPSGLHLGNAVSPTINPNLLGFFRNNASLGRALEEGNISNALNEGTDNALDEGPSNVLDEGPSNVLDEGPSNVFDEGPGIDEKPKKPKKEIDTRPSFFRPVGVGDLQVVQQELHRYELGEIAYIENVLASEIRERMHRQSNEQEITLFEEEESEQYMEQNLQSSERFELQSASKDEIERRSKNDSSFNLSASYGPTVEVKAGLQFSMENAKRSSNERSSQFAQELTESAVQRTQSKVKESRTEISRAKTEQSNLHRFENNKEGAEHIAGVYRYVDKIYNMRLVNRGVRFFYEFYIPSPGAYLRLLGDAANTSAELKLPKQPSLKISDITPKNYENYVQQYQVKKVSPPPLGGKSLTDMATDADDGTNGAQRVRREGAFNIEEGLEIKSVSVIITAFNQHSTDPQVWVTVGSETHVRTSGWPKLEETAEPTVFEFLEAQGQQGSLGYSLYARHDATVQVLFQVETQPSASAMLQWQHEVYDAILDAYQAQVSAAKADHAESLAGQSIQDLIDAPPARLREVERDELKRLCLQLMGGEAKLAEERVTDEGSFDMPLVVEANEAPMLEGDLPISRKRLDSLSVEVRFAEQAFEWANMSFTLYPYYWNNPDEWSELVSYTHSDPLHANFLRSGMARVLVPVRPNYEESVRDFVYRGRPALYSSEPAKITDTKWLPLHQEMREATQRRQEGDKLVDSWLTRVSTPLVMLDAKVQVDEHGQMMQRKTDEDEV